MDNERTEGATQNTMGKVKEGVGHALGDGAMESEGRADQATGKLRETVAGVKDAVRDADLNKDRGPPRKAAPEALSGLSSYRPTPRRPASAYNSALKTNLRPSSPARFQATAFALFRLVIARRPLMALLAPSRSRNRSAATW